MKRWFLVPMNVRICVPLMICIVLFIVLFGTGCSSSAPLTKEEVLDRLISLWNSRLPGSEFKIDPSASIVKPLDANRYHITLKNVAYTTDLTGIANLFYKQLISAENPYEKLNTARIEKMVLVYGPDDSFIHQDYMAGMTIENVFRDSQAQQSRLGNFITRKMSVTIGRVIYKELNANEMSQLNQNPPGITKDLPGLEILKPFQSTMENLQFEITGNTQEKDEISFLFNIEKIGPTKYEKEDPAISLYLRDQNAKPPDLNVTLEKKMAIMDLSVQLGKIKLSIKKNGRVWGNGSVENAVFSQFWKPDETGKSFKAGMNFEFNSLELNVPGNKKVTLLSKLKEFRFGFLTKHLGPEASMTLIEIMRKSLRMRDIASSPKTNVISSLAMKFMMEIMKAPPQITFFISPFKHQYGDIEIIIEFKLQNMIAGPVMIITVNLFNADGVLKKLKKDNVFSPVIITQISEIIDKYTMRNERGDAIFKYEFDSNALRKIMLKRN